MRLSVAPYHYLLLLVLPLIAGCRDDDDGGGPAPLNELIQEISGELTFLEIPPRSVELDALTDDHNAFAFIEQTSLELRQDLILDLSRPGDYFPDEATDEEQTWEAMFPGIVPAGTSVGSVYIHYDNETYNDSFNAENYLNCIGQYRVNATIRFTKPVLGIIMRASGGQDHLRQSDLVLGVPSVDYCEHNLRHFPGINIADGCRSDRFILSEDRKTFTLRNNTDIHHDNYRIILAAD